MHARGPLRIAMQIILRSPPPGSGTCGRGWQGWRRRGASATRVRECGRLPVGRKLPFPTRAMPWVEKYLRLTYASAVTKPPCVSGQSSFIPLIGKRDEFCLTVQIVWCPLTMKLLTAVFTPPNQESTTSTRFPPLCVSNMRRVVAVVTPYFTLSGTRRLSSFRFMGSAYIITRD